MGLLSEVWALRNPGTKHVWLPFSIRKMMVYAMWCFENFPSHSKYQSQCNLCCITFRQKLLVMSYGILLVKQNLQICRSRTYLHSYPLLSSLHWGTCSQGWPLKKSWFPLCHESLLCCFSSRLGYLRSCWGSWSDFVGYVVFFPSLFSIGVDRQCLCTTIHTGVANLLCSVEVLCGVLETADCLNWICALTVIKHLLHNGTEGKCK